MLVGNYVPISINIKLSPIPGNIFNLACFFVEKIFGVPSKIFKNSMRLSAIDFAFFHHREGGPESIACKVTYFLFICIF